MAKYEVIGTPHVETEYCTEYETVMVIDLKRGDGVTGDVWIVAGVPPYLQGTAAACGHQSGLQDVRVFGDSVDDWCPDSCREPDEDGSYQTVRDEIVEAVRKVALRTHNTRPVIESTEEEDERAQYDVY
jgi:hypothetical protein